MVRSRDSSDDAIPVKYRWWPTRVWLALILYWLTVMVGGAIWRDLAPEPRQPSSDYRGALALLTGLVIFSVCMLTERGRWRWTKRVLFIFVVFGAQVLLTASLLVGFESLRVYVDEVEALRGSEYFLASIPAVVFAMRQSRWFVEERV